MRLIRVLWILVLLLCIACGDSATNVTPGTMTIVSGDQQVASAGETLSTPLVVQISTDDGTPLSGRQVTWKPTEGVLVSPGTSVTGEDGRTSTVVTIGDFGGDFVVTASAAGSTPRTFSIHVDGQPALITLVAEIPMPSYTTFQHDVFVRDGLAFVCAWDAGVRIYDVGNGMKGGKPWLPQLVSSIITSSNGITGSGPNVHNAWWFHNPVTGEKKYLFAGQEGPFTFGSTTSGDIHVVDVSNLSAPVEVGYLHIEGAGTHNFWMDEQRQILYAAYYNAGVIAVDVSGTLSGNISSRIIARSKPAGSETFVWGVHLAKGVVYASDMFTGLWALDPNTLAPVGGGFNVPERFTSEVWTAGDAAYTGAWGTRAGIFGNVLKTWNISALIPVLVDSVAVGHSLITLSDVTATPDEKVLVVTGEGGGEGGLYLYSLQNRLHPAALATYVHGTDLHTGKVSVINGRTYVFASGSYTRSLFIFDITGAVGSAVLQ